MTAPAITVDFTDLRRVADAVLYEGYLLYPYRADTAKNQVRWQFGMVGPVGSAEVGAGEGSRLATQCLLQARTPRAQLSLRLRFLHVQQRDVRKIASDGRLTSVSRLAIGDQEYVAWQEAVEHEVAFDDVPLSTLLDGWTVDVAVDGCVEVVPLRDPAGTVAGEIARLRLPLMGELSVTAEAVADGLYVLHAALDNVVDFEPDSAISARDAAARRSFVSTHLLLGVHDGEFASMIDPPEWAADAAAECRNDRCWPVLGGEDGQTSPVLLAAPMILPDHPQIAPESQGDLFDATEIDEILSLRVMTMTDDEKRLARATDPRAAAIIDRCDLIPPEMFERLHGAVRGFDGPDPLAGLEEFRTPTGDTIQPDEGMPWWDPASEPLSAGAGSVVVEGVSISAGSHVILRPRRRADAHDMFLAGMKATVAAVHTDVDDGVHVAVTLDDDPAADLHEWYGRYYYFSPEEVEPR